MRLIFIVSLVLAGAACAQPLRPLPSASPWFAGKSGWVGADAAYTIPLGGGRLVWLFGDTFAGTVAHGRRENCVMIRNTAASDDGHPGTPLRFHLGHGIPGVFTPPDGQGWFWPLHGARGPRGLDVFLSHQLTVPGDTSAFGFRVTGHWLARVANPDDNPDAWRIDYEHLPYEGYGIATAIDGPTLYVYGYRDRKVGARTERGLVVARTARTDPARFGRWRFFDGARWVTDPTQAAPLFDGMATEGSVHHDARSGRWIVVYSAPAFVPEILVRTAPTPHGPWSAARVAYRCPEAATDKTVFCYAAKAHPELPAPDGETVVTYCTNTSSFEKVLADEKLYRPVVLSGRLAP